METFLLKMKCSNGIGSILTGNSADSADHEGGDALLDELVSQTFRNFAPQKFAVVGRGHFIDKTSQFCSALMIGEVGTLMGLCANTGWDHR